MIKKATIGLSMENTFATFVKKFLFKLLTGANITTHLSQNCSLNNLLINWKAFYGLQFSFIAICPLIKEIYYVSYQKKGKTIKI